MTPLLEEPRIAARNAREVSPPVAGPGRIEMPTHPAMPRLNSLSSLHTGRLRFAPAPTGDTASVEDADRPAAPARRMDRMGWGERAFEAGWVGLLAVCAAECAWRLL